MRKDNSDDRSPMAIGIDWSARMMTIGFEMALPPAAGYWLDLHTNTLPLFVIVGALLGIVAGMFHLMRIARQQASRKN